MPTFTAIIEKIIDDESFLEDVIKEEPKNDITIKKSEEIIQEEDLTDKEMYTSESNKDIESDLSIEKEVVEKEVDIDEKRSSSIIRKDWKFPSTDLLEYISDGLAYDLDSRIPKLAEEALYAYIIYNLLSTSSGVQEYVVQRFKRDRSAQLRNAKIRLSNMKPSEMIQTMRGKSKWIKH